MRDAEDARAGALCGYLRFRASQGDRVQALLAAIEPARHLSV
jgi:hypothetical protein